MPTNRTNLTEPVALWNFNPDEYIEVNRSPQHSPGELSCYQDPQTGELIVPLQHVNLMNIHNVLSGVDRSDVTLFMATGWYFELLPEMSIPMIDPATGQQAGEKRVPEDPWVYLAAADSDRLARMVAKQLRARMIPFAAVQISIDQVFDKRNRPKRSLDIVLYSGARCKLNAGLTAFGIANTTAYDPALNIVHQSPLAGLNVACDAVEQAVKAEEA